MSIVPIGSLGVHIGPLQSAGSAGSASGAGPKGTEAGGEGFSGALGKAIDSLEQSQTAAAEASQAVATGTTSNPEGAVVTVQNAELEMQLAAQIRTKATEAVQSIFQTQI
jgi:flagellar hook-basal body complex protein FliE